MIQPHFALCLMDAKELSTIRVIVCDNISRLRILSYTAVALKEHFFTVQGRSFDRGPE